MWGCSKGGGVAEWGCVKDQGTHGRSPRVFSLLLGLLCPSAPASLSASSPGEGEKPEQGVAGEAGFSLSELLITSRARGAKLRDMGDFPSGIEFFFRLQCLQISYFQ